MIGMGKPPIFWLKNLRPLLLENFTTSLVKKKKSLLRLCEFPNQCDKFQLIWIEIPSMFSAYSNNKNKIVQHDSVPVPSILETRYAWKTDFQVQISG